MVSIAKATWEDRFNRWSRPPGKTEQEKCENVVRMVRAAINEHSALRDRELDVYVKGSYANRTNVREDSDVDVSVRFTGGFYKALPPDIREDELGLTTHGYGYDELRVDLIAALKKKFGTGCSPGSIAIDIRENTYRVSADVVPCIEHRRYCRGSGGSIAFHVGEELRPSGRPAIINWPQQAYSNGVAKNDRTGRRFKAVVRILKNLKTHMLEASIKSPARIPSFLLECLVWNVPDEGFNHDTLTQDVRFALAHLWNHTRTDAECKEWGETNELKYLFRSAQPWTRAQAHEFLDDAWNHIGFE